MLVPFSWLKEYVEIKTPLPKLVERLSKVGVGVENVHKKEEDTVLELEITPNRPDLLSIIGVAREVAAMQSVNRILAITPPPLPEVPKPKKKLPLTIKVDYKLSPRVSVIIISGIKVKESPLWLQERLTSAGFRPINNIVDITNFVMMELGNPLHAFDYDQIKGHTMIVTAAEGEESFTSVDKITYKLPKDANVIRDKERIIDLCGIKGGLNSGITNKTKTVVLWVAVDEATNIRRTSQILGLRSEASSIYERGVNRGGTLDALARATSLIRKLAGGNVASNIIDLKKQQFNPWHLTLSLDRLTKILGIAIDEKKVLKILTALNLSPHKADNTIKVSVPTYRNDLQIEEDLIEEVARMYGYNKFPKTLPKGELPVEPIPYQKDYEEELRVKELMRALGMAEVNTYSLVSNDDGALIADKTDTYIHVANPVSQEYELLRPSLLINLLKAIPLNTKYNERVGLFELGKIYQKHGKEASENRSLAGVLYPADYFDTKGIVETLLEALSLPITFKRFEKTKPYQANRLASIFVGKEIIGTLGEVSKATREKLGIVDNAAAFEIDFEKLDALLSKDKTYKPIPKYPPLIEDLSIVVDKTILTGDLIVEMKATSPIVDHVDFMDVFEDTRTFRLIFQDPEKNLSSPEVATIRHQILKRLKQKFNATLKR